MGYYKITEEQYNAALAEGVSITADVNATNGDVAKAVETAKDQARKSGLDLNSTTIEIPASNESVFKTVKQLSEERFSNLKKNATYYTVNDFIKQCYKK